ncbi:putative F-box protein At2g39415 [Salvia miltiorrhiza]|uniref:putative F-box protein At2g39415 n=1 Tax=Salvia miltiorrhiza TaxID=226208 RepID=UPI0025ACDEE1|nr:putative F-box protein At2g39415 [Salvia miltiorrhiza]
MASSHFPRIRLSEHNEVSDSLDRLSELPDSLILSILSLLSSTRDVVRTTILSKRWKDLWTTVPCLEFEDENPEFICRVLAQWRGAKIWIFYLSLSDEVPHLPPPTSSDVESWLLFAVEKQVEAHMYVFISHTAHLRVCIHAPPLQHYTFNIVPWKSRGLCS